SPDAPAAAAPRPAAAADQNKPARAAVAPISTTAEEVPSTPQASVSSDVNLDLLWRDLLGAVGRASSFTRSYLLQAHPVSLAKNVFIIGFDPEFADQLELVDNAKTHSLLQTKLHELGHQSVQIKFIQAEAPASSVPAQAEAPSAGTP